tara:strand:- start:691 stop:1143 length:453 start_codon:yes stop_codon:yes gene_type:complete
MEGIAVMILYLVIGFFKNRKDKIKREKITADPNWDTRKKQEPNISLNKIFNSILDNDIEESRSNVFDEFVREKEDLHNTDKNYLEKQERDNSNKINSNKNQETKISQHINPEKELKQNKILKAGLLKDIKSIRKAIVLKEVLDKPLGLRK